MTGLVRCRCRRVSQLAARLHGTSLLLEQAFERATSAAESAAHGGCAVCAAGLSAEHVRLMRRNVLDGRYSEQCATRARRRPIVSPPPPPPPPPPSDVYAARRRHGLVVLSPRSECWLLAADRDTHT